MSHVLVPFYLSRLRVTGTALVATLLALALPTRAAAALHVVTTTEGLAALAREVGGERASVESLSRGVQDPHFVDANPMLAVKLRNADLLVDVGLELEIGWLPPLVNQSRNADIQPGGKRRFTAGNVIQVMDVPTGPLAQKLTELDPGGAAAYQANLAAFTKALEADMARWSAELAPFKGRKLFTEHRTLTYFLDWSGLVSVG